MSFTWASKGGLVAFPYYGPWSWMNRGARAFMDELVDSLFAAYNLDPRTPIVNVGGSMGGCSSLLYTRYARRPIAGLPGCLPRLRRQIPLLRAARPADDLPPRILRLRRRHGGDLRRALARCARSTRCPTSPTSSPHGEGDKAVSKANHSDPMVARMRARGHEGRVSRSARDGALRPNPAGCLDEAHGFRRVVPPAPSGSRPIASRSWIPLTQTKGFRSCEPSPCLFWPWAS